MRSALKVFQYGNLKAILLNSNNWSLYFTKHKFSEGDNADLKVLSTPG